ncbi:MAG: hypothetical protein AAF433_13645 [Bacteroidota bacterium]
MEENYFNRLRDEFCSQQPAVEPGRMMSSPAITYRGKVFAFFSRQRKMVFKLGKGFDPREYKNSLSVFNPFTQRPPMQAWFELSYDEHEQWYFFAEMALQQITKEQ